MKKKGEQRDLILNAAYKSISTNGYANTSLRTIAKEASVTLSQLHYYFGSKQDLFEEVIHAMKTTYLEEFKSMLTSSKTKDDNLTEISKYFSTLLSKNKELFALLFDLASLSLKYERFQTIMTNLFKDLEKMIEESVKKNTKERKNSSLTPKEISKLLLGTFLGIALQYSLDPNENPDRFSSMQALQKVLRTQ